MDNTPKIDWNTWGKKYLKDLETQGKTWESVVKAATERLSEMNIDYEDEEDYGDDEEIGYTNMPRCIREYLNISGVTSDAVIIDHVVSNEQENIADRLNLRSGMLRTLIEALANDRIAGKPVNAKAKRKELGITRTLAKLRGDVAALKIPKEDKKELLSLLK